MSNSPDLDSILDKLTKIIKYPPHGKIENNSILVNIDEYWYNILDSNNEIIMPILERARSYAAFLVLEKKEEYNDHYLLVDVKQNCLQVGYTEGQLLPNKTKTSFLGLAGCGIHGPDRLSSIVSSF